MDRGKAAMRHVVLDAEGKAVDRIVLLQLLIDRKDLIRRRVLAAEAVASADDDGVHARAVIRRLDVEVQRLADRAGLFRAVEHCDLFHRLRQILEEMLERERTEEMD